MIKFHYSISKKWHIKTYTFPILMIGMIFVETATFLDMIANYINTPVILGLIKIFFTLGAVLYTIGIILWTRFTNNMMNRLDLLSTTDPMTGVMNRVGVERVYSSFAKHNKPFYILVCDLDGTKK